MRAVGIGMDEADGDALVAAGAELLDQRRDLGRVGRDQHLALGVDALVEREPVGAFDQRRRQGDVEIILLEAVFGPHLDDIAKPLRGDQRGPRAAPLDQRVGGERGAVDHQVDVGQRDAGHLGDAANAFDDGALGRSVIGQDLGRGDSAVDIERHVGKRAADIGPDPT